MAFAVCADHHQTTACDKGKSAENRRNWQSALLLLRDLTRDQGNVFLFVGVTEPTQCETDNTTNNQQNFPKPWQLSWSLSSRIEASVVPGLNRWTLSSLLTQGPSPSKRWSCSHAVLFVGRVVVAVRALLFPEPGFTSPIACRKPVPLSSPFHRRQFPWPSMSSSWLHSKSRCVQ